MTTREEHEISDEQLPKIWLFVMYQLLFVSVEDKFIVDADLMAMIRKRLFLD